jgi:hypothetical protein
MAARQQTQATAGLKGTWAAASGTNTVPDQHGACSESACSSPTRRSRSPPQGYATANLSSTHVLVAQQALHAVMNRRRGAIGQPQVVNVTGVAVTRLNALRGAGSTAWWSRGGRETPGTAGSCPGPVVMPARSSMASLAYSTRRGCQRYLCADQKPAPQHPARAQPPRYPSSQPSVRLPRLSPAQPACAAPPLPLTLSMHPHRLGYRPGIGGRAAVR